MGPARRVQASPGGHREYTEGAVDRVAHIQELYAAALCSSKIAHLLPCARDTDGGPSATADVPLIGDLTAERDRIDRMIDDLHRSRTALDEVIDAAAAPAAHGPEQPARADEAGTAAVAVPMTAVLALTGQPHPATSTGSSPP
ncbi:hypothetical protein GCM10018966_098100 [Streptomyces yanii]